MPSNLGPRVLLLAVCALLCFFITPKSLSTTMGLLRLQPFGPVETVAAPIEQTTVRKIDLPGNDLVVDPNSQTIYVSVPSTDIVNGNKIAPLNPVTGTIGSPMFVGSEPNRMAISDNGRYIYVILDGALAVRRLDLLTRNPDLEITFGNSGSNGPIVPLGLAVQPGQPEAVAIARAPVFNVGGVAVYDNGIQRPSVAQPHAPNLVFSTVDSTRLYSVGAVPGSTALTRFNVSSNGVTSVGQSAIAGGGSAVFSGGRLYVSSGPVVDPETGTLLGTFTAPDMINTIAFTVDQNVQRAYFLTSPFSSPGQTMTATLRVFDIQTFSPVATVDIPNIIGRPTKLVRWGSNGLAFCSEGGFVHLIQTTLIPSPDPVPTPTPTPAGTPTPTPTPPIASAFVRVLSLPTSDLIYHPNSQKLYASTPSQAGSNGNSVVPINPTDGTIGSAIFVGSEPSKLARSDDGQFLYVGLDGAGGVRRVNVAAQTADLQFSLGTSHISTGWPNLPVDMEVVPGNAHTVAVSMRNTCCSPPQEGISVFDDGTRRGPVFIPPTDRSEIEFSPDGTTLYVLDSDSIGATFRKLGLTPTGIVSNQVNSFGSRLSSKMELDNGRLYFGNGAVASPEEPRLIGKFRTDNLGTLLVVPDSSVGRTFFINGAGFFDNLTTVQIVAFDQTTFLPVGAVNVSGVNGSVRSFVRWGTNGLAFSTSGGQIFLIQSDLVAPTAPAPTPTPTPTPTATPTPSPIPTPGVGELRQLSISTNDLVVSPGTQTIFASIPSNANANANTLAPIEPVAGTVGTPIPVGNNPNKLAISDNGAVMYVSLDGTNSVRQVEVASRQPGIEFSLGSDPVSGPYQAEDLAVAPNHPETVVVARMKPNSFPRHGGLVIFDNGILRGSVVPNEGNNRIEFSRSPEILYGQNNDNNFGFRRIAVSTCGALTVTTTQNLFRGFNVDFKVDNGVAVSSDGKVADAEAGVLLGVFKLVAGDNTFPPQALVAPELKARRVYYLLNDSGSTVLRVFDTATFLKVGELQIPGVSGTPSSLVRWGTNGLAFRTTTGQVFLLQHSLIGGNDPQFTLAPIPPTPTTRLSVHVDVPLGNAEGILMNMIGGLNATGVTNAAGNVSFNNIPICVGNVTVTPSRTSYAFAPASITVANAIDANLQFIGVLSVVGLASGAQVNIPESADRVTVAISRNNNFPSPVGVSYETIPNSASDRSDFTSTRRTIQFGPDETFKTISVLITDDALVEGTESFTIKLTDPFGAELNPLASSVTVNIIDNDTEQNAPNPLSNAQFFVRQHYQDFLNRAAADDPTGFNFWTNEITMCDAESDPLKKANCLAVKRINVSAAFFLSIEFQQTGYLVHRFYTSSFPAKPARPLGLPRLAEFLRDTQEIGDGVVVGANGWEQKLEQNKQAFALRWVARDEFVADHPLNQSAAEFVDSLFQNNSVTPTSTERAAAITAFGSGNAAGRAAALRSVAESQSVNQKQNSPAFVLMQYFGYLRRNPDDAPDGNFDGYQFWLNKLNQFNGNFVAAEMVRAFLESLEYQQRFGQANFAISQ